VNLKYTSVILATFSEDQRTILTNGMATWQDIFGFPAHTCEAGTVAAYVTPVWLEMLQSISVDRCGWSTIVLDEVFKTSLQPTFDLLDEARR
jgi:hypothetical protein